MFRAEISKIMYNHINPSFTIYKVELKGGQNYIGMFSDDQSKLKTKKKKKKKKKKNKSPRRINHKATKREQTQEKGTK